MLSLLAVLVTRGIAGAAAALPAPTGLLVEYLDFNATGSGQPPVVSTAQPRFSFKCHDEHNHPGNT